MRACIPFPEIHSFETYSLSVSLALQTARPHTEVSGWGFGELSMN